MYEPEGYYTVLLLQAIRDGHVSDWESLRKFRQAHGLRFINWGSRSFGEAPATLSLLQDLQRAKLVQVVGIDLDRGIRVGADPEDPRSAGRLVIDTDGHPRDSETNSSLARSIRIDISPSWAGIQDSLRLSLTDIAALLRRDAIVAVPRDLPEIRQPRVNDDVFVLMPFQPELRPVYDEHISKVCRRLSLSVSRADDLFAAQAVMADVWDAIKGATLIVADCTGRNPNVFYEIGLAHALGKPVVLLTQETSDVPFDLQHIRYIAYEYTPPGMRQFEKALKAALLSTLENT